MDERTPSPEDWARLGREVKRRRVELGLTQQQVAADGGPSVSILTKIETAKKPHYEDMVLARLERRLRWEAGSIADILADKPPRELTPSIPGAGDTAPGHPVTSLADADQIGVASILRIINAQQRELEQLRATVEDLQRAHRDGDGEEQRHRKHG